MEMGTLAPRVKEVTRTGSETLVITLTDLGITGAVMIRNTTGFKAMVVSSRSTSEATWMSTPVVVSHHNGNNTATNSTAANTVTLGDFPAGATRLRHLWCKLKTANFARLSEVC